MPDPTRTAASSSLRTWRRRGSTANTPCSDTSSAAKIATSSIRSAPERKSDRSRSVVTTRRCSRKRKHVWKGGTRFSTRSRKVFMRRDDDVSHRSVVVVFQFDDLDVVGAANGSEVSPLRSNFLHRVEL